MPLSTAVSFASTNPLAPTAPVNGAVVVTFPTLPSTASLQPSSSESKSKRFTIPSLSVSKSVQTVVALLEVSLKLWYHFSAVLPLTTNLYVDFGAWIRCTIAPFTVAVNTPLSLMSISNFCVAVNPTLFTFHVVGIFA